MSRSNSNQDRSSPTGLLWDDGFRAILDSAMDAVIAMDAHGCVIEWNRKAEEVLGWSRDEALGQHLADLIILPEMRSAHRIGMRRFLETGDSRVIGRRLELPALRKSGDSIPVELNVTAVETAGGWIFNAFLRDVSDRGVDAEYRARMAALVDSSYDAIISKDIAGTIQSWNQGAERMYGYSEDEAVGKTINLVLPASVVEEEAEIQEAISAGQRLEQFHTLRRRKDGGLLHVSLTVSPITDDRGVITGSSTIERDITESQRQQEELRQAKEEAERAFVARTEFLANVSHELRTPMNAIIGMTQLALEEAIPDDIRDYVQTANDSAHSLLTLLNDILDFSKLESNTFTIERDSFSLRAVVDETVKPLSTRAFEKGLELACEIGSDVPDHIIGDGGRLRQVLTNLISNAIKFTDRGEVVVVIEALRVRRQACRLKFSVRDTGIGISETDQRRILQPFTQADASTTRRFGGTGLGLSICSELLQLMDSRLSISSTPRQGSCFSFELSMPRGVDDQREALEQVASKRLRKLPVLIVDDNTTSRGILMETMNTWEMDATAVDRGELALSKLAAASYSARPYALLVVDAMMPGMDGCELIRQGAARLKTMPPVILMGSLTDRHSVEPVVDVDAQVSFLQKPVSQSDLLDAMLTSLEISIAEPLGSVDDVPSAAGTSLTVLVAEDTPANQKVVTRILEKRGHHVVVANNGRDAVELTRRESFDVVLMDIQMPIMDGFQATAAIRTQNRDEETAAVPIVAMTAHAMRGDRRKCIDAGMDGYISKPINTQKLLQIVERFGLRAHRAAAAGTTASGPTHRGVASPQRKSSAYTQEAGDDCNTSATEQGDSTAPLSDVLDLAGTLKRLAGDWELFRDLVNYFDEDSKVIMRKLREALDSGSAHDLEQAAHAMKGLVANLGALRCSAAAQALEQAGRSADLTNAATLFEELEAEVRLLDRVLESHRV